MDKIKPVLNGEHIIIVTETMTAAALVPGLPTRQTSVGTS
jgi:hypothetical protein